MFHKYKRRRFTRSESEKDSLQEFSGASFAEYSELAQVIERFEPAHCELQQSYFERSSYPAESRKLKTTRDELVREATVSEMPTGERTLYFDCYDPTTRFYKERKLKMSRDSFLQRLGSLG